MFLFAVTQGLLLAASWMLGIETCLATCKVNTLPAVLWSTSQILLFCFGGHSLQCSEAIPSSVLRVHSQEYWEMMRCLALMYQPAPLCGHTAGLSFS